MTSWSVYRTEGIVIPKRCWEEMDTNDKHSVLFKKSFPWES